MSVKRTKDEPSFAERLLDVVDDLANEDMKQSEANDCGGEPRQQTVVQAEVKREAGVTVDFPPLVLRLRATVQFKTSSGRVLTAEDQPASMTYADFRKLFSIPLKTPKRTIFKKSDDQWIVAVGDDMQLPLVDGFIVAETCTDF
ncbi:hypothetical protein AAVH_21248 [Aphelenchoides avenae]|nr:hypothetical protein AAVH_21248 [Aphelenchus avenae]